MEWLRPSFVLTFRTILGLLLGMTFGFVGVLIGWVSFVFFGATSGTTLLGLFMGGAAIGTAVGVFMAWMTLDGNVASRVIITMGLLVLAAAGGSWGGYQFGSIQEVPCCAKPDVTPITYIVIGSVAVTSVVAFIMNVSRQAMPLLRR